MNLILSSASWMYWASFYCWRGYKFRLIRSWGTAGSILSVESNQNVESKTKNVESKTEKCGVQNSIFTSRNQLFWALTHLIQYNLHSSASSPFQIYSCYLIRSTTLQVKYTCHKVIKYVMTQCQRTLCNVSARNLVSRFSGKSLKLLPPDVRF